MNCLKIGKLQKKPIHIVIYYSTARCAFPCSYIKFELWIFTETSEWEMGISLGLFPAFDMETQLLIDISC